MSAGDLGYLHVWQPGEAGAPTLLLLHGTGGTEHDLVDLGRSLVPRAHLLSPRGNVDERGMNRFFRRLSEGVFDQADLARRTQDLAAFVRDASGSYRFDPARVVAVGFSNGANIAASLLLAGTGVLAGAVLLAPMVPFVPDPLPALDSVPVFIGAGRADPMVPVAGTEQLAALLAASGARVETFWHPGGHQLARAEIESAQVFLRKGDQPWN